MSNLYDIDKLSEEDRRELLLGQICHIYDGDVLGRLSKSKDEAVRWLVANNEATPIDVLIELSHDKASEVRCGVARNSSVSFSILEELAKDDHLGVRYEVALNNRTPIRILKIIAQEAGNSAAGHLARRRVQQLLQIE